MSTCMSKLNDQALEDRFDLKRVTNSYCDGLANKMTMAVAIDKDAHLQGKYSDAVENKTAKTMTSLSLCPVFLCPTKPGLHFYFSKF